MDLQHYYLELSPNPIRFDTISALTNIFFDDSKQQVFVVRSGGATGILVKSADNIDNFIFRMEPREQEVIRSIKFSPDDRILAVQRKETTVDFIPFSLHKPNLNNILVYKSKSSIIFGFIWINENQVAIISNNGAEIIQIMVEKMQLKSLRSTNMTINWFSWCPTSNWGLLSSNDGTILTPVIFKPGLIIKLPRLELGTGQSCSGRDITLGQLYGTNAIMILKQTTNSNRCFEVIIYMLHGPGVVPKKTHILRLGRTGRFAINVLDDLIIVHHQASATSMIFDIALDGEVDHSTGIISHAPILPAKAIKPFTLELPSIEFDGKTMNCKLYSQDWVLFQPNIVIDGSIGCLWFVILKLEVLCMLIVDKVRLIEVLLHRTDGKSVILNVLKDMMTTDYNGASLTIIENVFDKLNHLYKLSVDVEVQSQMGNAFGSKTTLKVSNSPARVLIDQSDMFSTVFSTMNDLPQLGSILLLYVQSLLKHGIQIHNYDLSKMIIIDLVKNSKFETLHQLLKSACLNETKPLACFLLSLSSVHPSISQMALDMLARLNANEIIIEVLLEKGQVIDALRLASSNSSDGLPARKYLEAASRTNDTLIFHSVFKFFQLRNLRLRGSMDFLRQEQCGEYVQHYQYLKDIDAL